MLRRMLFFALGTALLAVAISLPASAQYGGGYGGGYHGGGVHEPSGKPANAKRRRDDGKPTCTRQKVRTRDESGGYREEWRQVCE